MLQKFETKCTWFASTYTKIGTIQRRLAWPLRKDDTQNREAFHIFCPQMPKVCKNMKIEMVYFGRNGKNVKKLWFFWSGRGRWFEFAGRMKIDSWRPLLRFDKNVSKIS